jgi:hypothetical protein
MTNKERYEKMKKAQELIREVEFSYKEGEEPRRLLYRFVVHSFSVTGMLNGFLTELREKVRKETGNNYYV